MRDILRRTISLWTVSVLTVIFGMPGMIAYAQNNPPTSTNYKLQEAYFGVGGEQELSSSNYDASAQAGSLGVGDTSSTNYDATAGGVTQFIPFLEFVVTQTVVDFGVLSDSVTSYGAPTGMDCGCSFYVRTYVSSAYSVVNASSQPPTSAGGAFLDPKTVLGTPSASTDVEEFGFNLVANTSPGSFGADPANFPDDTFADGTVSTGYDTPNNFKFVSGDTIAESPATSGNQAVGQTNYTISYIAKRSSITEAGTYTLNHDLVVVPIY